MKIYLAESKNFMAYSLVGDLGQEYNSKVYPKSKDINSLEKSLEMALFYVYANKPIYTKKSPKIYLHNNNKEITQVDILQFKDTITKNLFFKKYTRDTSQSLLVQDKKVYEDEDNERIQELSSQLNIKERDLFMLNQKLLDKKQHE